MISPVNYTIVSSKRDYELYKRLNKKLYSYRYSREIDNNKLDYCNSYSLKGYCDVCDKEVEFVITDAYAGKQNDGRKFPNYREQLFCPNCGLNNRMRATMDIIDSLLFPESDVYIMEQTTIFYQKLSRKLGNKLIGSEYISDVEFGKTDINGIRSESCTALTFENDSLDMIVSLDVFEHVPNYKKAFSECKRVLKKGGVLLFSVPFIDADSTEIRAQIDDDGTIKHLLEPEYHGDPINEEGCLCYYHFGWDILDELRLAGFEVANAVVYWNESHGYLGATEQIFFVAQKEYR